MSSVEELEHRLRVACDKISDRLAVPPPRQVDPEDLSRLNNQVRLLTAEKSTMVAQFRTRIEQLDATLTPLKEAAEKLRATNRDLRAGQPGDATEELASLRAERVATKAELDAAIAVLKVLGKDLGHG